MPIIAKKEALRAVTKIETKENIPAKMIEAYGPGGIKIPIVTASPWTHGLGLLRNRSFKTYGLDFDTGGWTEKSSIIFPLFTFDEDSS